VKFIKAFQKCLDDPAKGMVADNTLGHKKFFVYSIEAEGGSKENKTQDEKEFAQMVGMTVEEEGRIFLIEHLCHMENKRPLTLGFDSKNSYWGDLPAEWDVSSITTTEWRVIDVPESAR
jgi:hypothetical protein